MEDLILMGIVIGVGLMAWGLIKQDKSESVPVHSPRGNGTEAVQFDPGVLHGFAKRLYDRASSIIYGYTIAGALIGLVAGFAIRNDGATVVLGIFLGVVGYLLGVERAFWLKFQAQTTLCQVNIEENTAQLVCLFNQGSVRQIARQTSRDLTSGKADSRIAKVPVKSNLAKTSAPEKEAALSYLVCRECKEELCIPEGVSMTECPHCGAQVQDA